MANTSPTAQRPAQEDATSSAKPVATFRYGNVSAAVFSNQVKTKDGKTFDVHNTSIRRSYRKTDGTWGHVSTLRKNDLPAAAFALMQCSHFLNGSKEVLSQVTLEE